MDSTRRVATTVALVVVATLVAGCKARPPVAPEQEPGSPEDAEREVASLLGEAYQSIKRSNAPGMMSLIAADAFVGGPRQGDVGVERSAALVALGDALRVKKAHKVRSAKLRVGSAPDGRSAWAVDRVDVDGKPYVVVALAAEIDGLWALTTVHVAGVSKSATAPAAPLPAWSGEASGAHRPAPPDAEKVLRQLTGEPDLRVDYLDHYADRQSILVRSSSKTPLYGVKSIKKAWKKKPPVWTVDAPLASASTPDGAFTWIVAPASLDGEPPGSRRILVVLEKFEDEAPADPDDAGDDADDPDFEALPWRLVVLQETAPVP
jgi:hypothetical protein